MVKEQTFPSSAFSINSRNFSNTSAGGHIHSLNCKSIPVIKTLKIKYLSTSCQEEKTKTNKQTQITTSNPENIEVKRDRPNITTETYIKQRKPNENSDIREDKRI